MAELPGEVIDARGVRLRRYTDADIPDVALACNDPETLRFLHLLPDPYTIDHAAWWVRIGAPAGWAAGGAPYAIADPDSDRLIGSVGLSHVSRERGQAEIGYWVAPWARGRGVATAATGALSRWGHAQGLGRLELLAEPENVPSLRVALSAGYRFEGRRRGGGISRSGARHDVTVWSRLADDPAGPAARTLPDLPDGRLTDGVVTLRPLDGHDADDAYQHRQDPHVVATSVPPVAPDRFEVVRRCNQALSHWLIGQRADMVIADGGTGRYAGEISLWYQEPATGQAMIGYSVSPAWRGRGYAARAVRLMARWVFSRTAIARLVAGTDVDNGASQRVLEKAGFRREGHERGRLPGPDGRRHDGFLYALVASDVSADQRRR